LTAIAGFLAYGADHAPEALCSTMLEAQRAFGPDHPALLGDNRICMGRRLYRLLPEDSHDVQPSRSAASHLALVADIRIDDREELKSSLQLGGAKGRLISDADLLLLAYERWEEGILDRLVGDFAFAVWDRRRHRLLMARDPLGQRPLHYHSGNGFFAFSSMPQGLHALPMVARAVNQERAAEFVADRYPRGPATYFKDIFRVEPGHVVTVSPDGLRSRRYWQPRPAELRLRTQADYVEAFREQLDRATKAMLRGGGPLVASHLSSGYDSSAVTATAARLLQPAGGKVLAYTAAPREGFDGPVPRGRIADESALAAATAAMHPNVEHVVVRPSGESPFLLLDRRDALVAQPSGHICNGVWGNAIKRAAKSRGVSVLLVGQIGNYSVSAGGRGQLADFIRSGQFGRWWRESRNMVAKSPMRWRGILDNSFGPWIPLPLYSAVSRRFRGSSRLRSTQDFVTHHWSERMARPDLEAFRDPRPAKDSRALTLELLQAEDSGNFRKASLAAWGIDERDPTGDRRLIEFCLSLPAEMLLRDGEKRPLARAALADRLPAEVLDEPNRGYQMADWYEQITPQMVKKEAARLRGCPAAASVVDFDHVAKLIDAWPQGGWDRQWVISEYRASLLRALSAAHFLCTFSRS
jgi:asparagine synthase (glutamine-hydrolysing)